MVDIIGENALDKKSIEKISGIAKYSADFRMDGMLYLKVLMSSVSHAELLGIDFSEALKIPGVAGVITAKDVPGENKIGVIVKDQPVLTEKKIRYKGETIAIVGADSIENAERALKAIHVDYKELKPIFDPVEAMRPDSIRIHEKGNILMHRTIKKGDIDKGFAECDIVIENTYSTQMVEHAYIERESGLGFIDEEGRITVVASTQFPHENQKEIAHELGLNLNLVRVIQANTGGGFGGKIDSLFECIVALAVYKFRRPVKLSYSCKESFLTSTKRHPAIVKYKTGAKKNGRIIAVDVEIIFNNGAYASLGPGVATRAAIHATGPYEIPNVMINSYCIYTNNPVCGAMRGFGVPSVTFAHESQIDILAEKLGIDSFEIRRINFLKKGSPTATGQILYNSVGIEETLAKIHKCTENTDRSGSIKDRKKKLPKGRTRGRGVASTLYGVGMTGLPNPSEARIEIRPDSRICIFTGAADIGQGSDTVFGQIAAQELNINYDDIFIQSGDTAKTPDSGNTAATRQTYVTGNAVKLAAMDLKKKLFEIAAELLEANAEDLDTEEGKIFVKGSKERCISFAQAVNAIISRKKIKVITGEGRFDPPTTKLDPETGQGIPYTTYAFGTQMAEVEVDKETGIIYVKRFIAAYDVGKAINPGNVECQIAGGISMGIGYALTENYIPAETDSFSTYLIPTSLDMPEVNSLIVEDPEPSGPFGAKGVGEPAMNPTAAAIANAVYDATGIRINELPLTPEKVFAALKKRG